MPMKTETKTKKKKAVSEVKNAIRKKIEKKVAIAVKKIKLFRPFKAVFSGDKITSNAKQATELYGQSRFGEMVEGKVQYSAVEALYLCDKKRMSVYSAGKKLSFDKLMEKLKEKDKRIGVKYVVFKDMRNRGYIVKTALKFGAEFRVYGRGVKPGQEHAKWILYPVHESSELTWHEFAAKNRVAHSTRKNLLIAIVDEENSVTYYQVSWIRP